MDTITLGTKNDTEQFVSIKIYPQAKEDPKIKVCESQGRPYIEFSHDKVSFMTELVGTLLSSRGCASTELV